MAGAFVLVLLTAAFGLLFAIPVILIPWLFAPRNPTPMKRATFEAGQVPTGNARVHLMMQYYPYLLIFVVFDVISMFLYAWATSFVQIPGAISIGLFLGMIFVPLGFALYLAGMRDIW
jgi:NADH-quinone oxidoreductase subunit A